MRLDRFIASQRAELSRSDVKALIKRGRVTVNGAPASRADMQISENSDTVCLGGEEISYREHVYIMLNKPAGVICATRDGLSKTVLELVPPELRRAGLFPAGRLDKDTEGFVLLTDDGALAHRMLSPVSHVPKTYLVKLEKPCEKGIIDIFAAGAVIDGNEKCLPAELTISPDPCLVTLVLHEGKYHQVKRMFLSVNNKVLYLKRISIGNMVLDENLAPGKCLEILHKDVEKLLAQS
ncbi:MAG: rRNA pseudouridine synthase [Ruminococcus sp.]|nr:rRNA pseudouridine synthase [Ruminococcus sp.]